MSNETSGDRKVNMAAASPKTKIRNILMSDKSKDKNEK